MAERKLCFQIFGTILIFGICMFNLTLYLQHYDKYVVKEDVEIGRDANIEHKRMNVLFLISDDMRPQLGSYLGQDFPSPVHPTMYTPNLDGLAKKSLVLKRAYVQSAHCSPSRASVLTGRRPDTTHVYLGEHFREAGGNFTTIPQYFKRHGYTSVAIGKIFHPVAGIDNEFFDHLSWSKPWRRSTTRYDGIKKSWKAIPDSELINKPLVDAKEAQLAIEALQQFSLGRKPFFLAVGFHKPHLPWVFPESMLKLYPEESIALPDNPYAPVGMPDIAWNSYTSLNKYDDLRALNFSANINSTLPDKKVKELRRAYYCTISWVDEVVGRVLRELDTLGLANNTIISFWGDHGWQLGEHGEWQKMTNFELATHAPMMISIPGLTDNGISTRQLTEFVDLFPTLVEAAGLPSLSMCPVDSTKHLTCSEGLSLIPLISNKNKPLKNAAFSQYIRDSKGRTIMGYTMRTDRYRYTEWVDFEKYPVFKPSWDKLHGIELYDHSENSQENINMANVPAYKGIKQILSRQLHDGWRAAGSTGSYRYNYI